MKHNLLKSVILSVILLMGVSNAWAYNFGDNNGNNQVTIWFDNSTTQLSEIEIYFWQSTGHSVDWAFTHISGTDYWYINTNFANFAGFKIHGKPKNSTDEWGWETYERHDEVHSGWYARCVSPNSTDKGSEITWTIPGLTNVNFINTTTAENVLAGAGTNSNPYIIKPATNITVKLTGDLIDNQCSKSYKFGTSNASTTQTYTVNSSATAGSAYNIEGFTGATRDTYTSRYASAGTLYFKTAYNISASVNGGHGTVAITNGGEYVYQGNTTFQLTATPEDGYEVDTWSVSGGTKTVTGNTITITAANNSDVTVSVTFKAKKYIVTLDNQSATTAGTASVQATYGSAMPSATMPQKTGYTFGGYYTAINGGGIQYYTANGTSSKNWDKTAATTLYAKWTANQYTVKFNGNGSTSGSMSDQSFTYDEAAKALTTNAFKKTGYTFARWNTAADGSGTSYADKATVRNLTTTNNATITLYAQWTEKPKYTVTITSDGNGTVSPNTAQVGEIPVTITATPNDGYKFKNWTKTGKVTIADANNASTTITATGTGSVTANFEKVNRIYLKPAGDNNWATGNPRYVVYIKNDGAGNEDTSWSKAVNMTLIKDGDSDPGNDIYYADISPEYTYVIFCRMDPNNANNGWDGIRWTQTKDLMILDDCNLFDVEANAKTEKENLADGTWMKYNAWHLAGDFNAWALCGQTYEEQGNTLTFTQHLEAGKTYQFKLVYNGEWYGNNGTMERGGDKVHDGGWTMSTSENNCQIKTDLAGEYIFTFNASTKTLTVQYPVLITLNYCEFGTYGIRYNGQTYYAKSTTEEGNLMVSVPYGAEITLIEGKPLSDLYTGDIVNFKTGETLDPNEPITVTGDITLEDNFVTINEHDVYLGVPNTCDWDKTDSYANFTWRKDVFGSLGIRNSTDLGKFAFEANAVKYYKFTIPAGCSKFRFQRKQALDDDDEANKTTTYSQTADHQYMILNTATNCYRLDGKKVTEDKETFYTGYWCELPPAAGDYRLLYVEQVVEKGTGGDSWKTIVTRKKAHPSDIVRKNTTEGTHTNIVSLHIYKDRTYSANDGSGTYTSSSNPEVILQRCTGYQNDEAQWEDIERHMVYGPLEAPPGMAMAPGRRKTSAENPVLIYDDGIDRIKNYENSGNGVWNFTVQQTVTKNNETLQIAATLLLDEEHLQPYVGNYYIRTKNAEGGWYDYTIPANHMHFSQYAKENSGFSHYFCKWVEIETPETKFTVANDYGMAISDTLIQDSYTDASSNIPDDANIRWSWNETTNELARAYIQGTWKKNVPENASYEERRNWNLVVNYKASSSAGATDGLLDDSGDWIYQKDFDVKVGSHLNSLTATYPVNSSNTQTFAENLDMLVGDPETNKLDYKVRILYDFKINKTLIALVPNVNDAEIAIDVMIERIDQGPATQVQAPITYNQNQRSGEGSTVYAVMSFTKDHLRNANASEQEKLTYWISFPFDVTISDVFGFGEVGQYWMIKYYDGAERANIGWFLDTKTFWKYKTKKSDVLRANTGYVLTLNKKVMDPNSPIFTNTNTVSLYFPSTDKITTINPKEYTVTEVEVPTHTCTITSPSDRTTEDSNWNLIGVPSYANKNCTTTTESVKYFYDYNYQNDTYAVAQNEGPRPFQSMFAYMVQYGGYINWNTFEFTQNGSQGLVAKKANSANNQHNLRLELQQNGTKADQTFVQLQDEDATEMFDMNSDLCKIINAGSNIYSIISTESTPVNVAGNVMPIQETIIPLGVVSAAAGEYTFAMPDGTDGIIVELIDYETNTRTNMTLDEYTVNLGKGTFESRFALHVKPDKTVTSVEDINTNSDGVRKFIIDGVLYMQKDGMLYDAQGRCVQ